MKELCILFAHHAQDAVTLDHLARLRDVNPNADVVPIGSDDGQPASPVPDAERIASTFTCGTNWHNCDLVMRQWFIEFGHAHPAERYIWAEWDSLPLVSYADWYRDAWNADATTSAVYTPADHPDHWWLRAHGDFVPRAWKPFLTTMVPFNGLMLSHRALAAYAAEPLHESLFCELRLPTFLRYKGFDIQPLPPAAARANQFLLKGQSIDVDSPGIWHPVKTHPFGVAPKPAPVKRSLPRRSVEFVKRSLKPTRDAVRRRFG